MCGIFGFITPRRKSLAEMQSLGNNFCDILKNRGPDDHGFKKVSDQVFLGHTRLSIINLTPLASQPQSSSSGRYCITFNGEIYNYKELDKILNSKGYISHSTGSDTVTILNMLDCFGVAETLTQLNGMFAIGIWDEQEQTLNLVRDRMGEKPMYYGTLRHLGHDMFFFSSDLNVLKSSGVDRPSLNKSAIHAFFDYGNVPAPLSIYENINKLRPGHRITINFNGEKISEEEFWIYPKPSYSTVKFDDSLLTENIEQKIEQSVASQSVSDVNVGCFLSGGIDSSLVTALLQKNSCNPVSTYSLGFEDNRFDEARYAKKIADFLGTDHNELVINESDLLETIPLMSSVYSEPFADPSQIPTFLLSKFTSNSQKVVLSGDGADELFSGYHRYNDFHRFYTYSRLLRYVPKKFHRIDKIRKLSELGSAHTPLDVYRRMMANIDNVTYVEQPDTKAIKGLFPSVYLQSFIPRNLDLMHIDSQFYIPNDITVKVDRAAMYNSLEVRAPFLDHTLIEFMNALPNIYRQGKFADKFFLKQILKKYVPIELFDRKKTGFGIPLKDWTRGSLKSMAIEFFSETEIDNQGIWDKNKVLPMLSEHFTSKRDWSRKIWKLIMFQCWYYDNYVK
jgi:asparagine synthase (glutamine-hydrolysing)